jgi:hypothetical protein
VVGDDLEKFRAFFVEKDCFPVIPGRVNKKAPII